MNAHRPAIMHQRARALHLLAPAILLVACTDGNTAPEVIPVSIDVVVSKPVLTRITDSTSIDVTVNGSPAGNATIEMVSETRDISSVPVITNSALARRMIVPSGPGIATLRVRSGSAEPKTFSIEVQFDRPTVLSAQSSTSGIGADTTTLMGVMLGHLSHDQVRVGGTPVDVLTQTATSLTFVLPPRADPDCGGRAHAPALTIDGADVAPLVKVNCAWLSVSGGRSPLPTSNASCCLQLVARTCSPTPTCGRLTRRVQSGRASRFRRTMRSGLQT